MSLLKKRVGPLSVLSSTLPEFDDDGKLILQPVKVLARWLVKKDNAPAIQLLVQWAHLPEQEATWEFLQDNQARFPNLRT